MFRRATSLAALTAIAIAGLGAPADAQDRGRGNDRRAERNERADRGREMPREERRERRDDGQRGQGGPAGCRGGGSVIGAIAGGLMGSGSVGRPC